MNTDVEGILATHLSDNGWCGECRELWERLVPWPCPQSEWAQAVQETTADRPSGPRRASVSAGRLLLLGGDGTRS